MSHFYGVLRGSRGEATHCGTKNSGLTTHTASYRGGIVVRLWYDEATGEDRFSVGQEPWRGGGISEPIASGVLGQPLPQTREEL